MMRWEEEIPDDETTHHSFWGLGDTDSPGGIISWEIGL